MRTESGFNTVNDIRVHAMSLRLQIWNVELYQFQYRKRYKGACNFRDVLHNGERYRVSIP